MTMHQDMIYALGGVPTLGQLPIFVNAKVSGDEPKYYFVDANNGSDGNTGLKPKQAFATIAKANTVMRARVDWSDSPWAQNDVCVIAPGSYDEALTTMAHGVTYIGLGMDVRDGQNGVRIKPATDGGSPVEVGGLVNSAFYNIGFETGDGDAGSYAFKSTVLNNCYFQNCFFTGPAETATIGAALYTSDLTKTTFKDCWFCNADVGVDFVYADAGDKVAYLLMDGCIVSGCDTAGIRVSLNLIGPHSLLRNCHVFGGGQTMALGLDDNVDILTVNNCYFEATANDPASGAGKYNGSYLNGALIT